LERALFFDDSRPVCEHRLNFFKDIFNKMLQGMLAMLDGAQTGNADAGNLEAS
jgi:hypothetical protein